MELTPVVIAIPIYFLLIGIELVIQHVRKIKLYRVGDALTNISCGITQQTTNLFFKIGVLFIYHFIYEQLRIFTIEPTWYSMIILFVAADFCYYWSHRMSHEINLFWGGHVVHHQSEDYNLSVALRQGTFQILFTAPFYWPLALLGFDVVTFTLMSGLVTVYQFWIHTETIDKMGWFEKIFNTPSHHRVHHGRNPKYIDKNHAGVFIIWDKMFGTFQEEEERPVYGVTVPTNSWNPVWVNLKHFKEMAINMKDMKMIDKVRFAFKKPGWMPSYLGGMKEIPDVDKATYVKYDTPAPASVNYYAIFQYLIALVITALFLFKEGQFVVWQKVVISTYIIWSVVHTGIILEKKKWFYVLEPIRIISGVVLGFLFVTGSNLMSIEFIIIISVALISFVWLYKISKIPYENTILKESTT
ncbi:sterol desaturase family protein [Marinigracilibium pacificum]|uniref:Sterol desaturase family protein n=1 Tax=Marinigracilibium pacificum TaxID=2729599 RepID=A0A848J0X2_9BACT|nr:sterol desaturase family protein [Marinigracilibium pacificum]NMM50433.1 sterol desaturase family protein [Marinigracilibium pacificum]